MSEVPLHVSFQWTCLQKPLEHKAHHAAGAYSRPMPMSLGPPCERCGTSCSSNPCIP